MLNKNNYYQDNSYWSFTLVKKFIQCEAAAMAELSGQYKPVVSDAMLIGSYVDAVLAGELEQFMLAHPEIISSQGPTKGQLKAGYRNGEVMVARVLRDQFFAGYLQGEKQPILTGEISGIPVKSKLDFLMPGAIVDFKTTKDFEPVWYAGGYVSFIEAYSYDTQGAIYQELVRQNTKKKLPYYIAAVTKESVPDIAIIHIPDKLLDLKLQEVEHYLPELNAVKLGLVEPHRCEKCDYCKDTKVLTNYIEMEELI